MEELKKEVAEMKEILSELLKKLTPVVPVTEVKQYNLLLDGKSIEESHD